MTKQAAFKRFDECTKADIEIIMENYQAFARDLPKRVMAHLQLLDGDFGGFNIDRLEHCLQTATRAVQDGKNEEYVVCALLHDIGDTLGPYNHGALAATILKPFVSEANYWLLQHHLIFQGYYYFEHIGQDKHARDALKENPHYDYTLGFIEKYDMPSFDESFESLPLSHFTPMVERVLSK